LIEFFGIFGLTIVVVKKREDNIVIDQLMKGPLSLAGAVPEVNSVAIALRKKCSKCRADSQRVSLSKVYKEVYCSSSRS